MPQHDWYCVGRKLRSLFVFVGGAETIYFIPYSYTFYDRNLHDSLVFHVKFNLETNSEWNLQNQIREFVFVNLVAGSSRSLVSPAAECCFLNKHKRVSVFNPASRIVQTLLCNCLLRQFDCSSLLSLDRTVDWTLTKPERGLLKSRSTCLHNSWFFNFLLFSSFCLFVSSHNIRHEYSS